MAVFVKKISYGDSDIICLWADDRPFFYINISGEVVKKVVINDIGIYK